MRSSRLSDEKLVERLLRRVAVERGCTADVLEDIGQVDARDIYVVEGYSSLSEYCMKALGYSQDESFPRVAAARLVRRFPLALQMLRDGTLTLSTLRTIGRGPSTVTPMAGASLVRPTPNGCDYFAAR